MSPSKEASIRSEDVYDVEPDVEEKKHEDSAEDTFRVCLDEQDDPKNLAAIRKWIAVFIISAGSICVTCSSSMAAFASSGVAAQFHVSTEVANLGISLFVLGLGTGTLFVGPVSEIYGRNVMYQVSFLLFWIFSWPVAFAPNIAVYLLFRFVTGCCSSAFFSVAGGSVSDMFVDSQVGPPMAIYSLSPFLGPVLGPMVSGFIIQNTTWRWVYYVTIIWSFIQLTASTFLVPETFVPIILVRKARRLRKSTGDKRYWAPLERQDRGMARNIYLSVIRAFQIPFYERMALLLDLWNSVILGILYLTFEAFPIIFGNGHRFSAEMIGLTFMGIGGGMLIAACSQPFWNRLDARMMVKYNGHPPPEVRLIMGQVGGVLIPIGLFWLAFTTYPRVHWIVPVIASVPFGIGICYVFTSTFTYLVVAYRPVAASAMAGNAFMRTAFASAFPLFAGYMYTGLGTVGATALLAGVTTILAPVPFIFYKIGARLRQNSRFSVADS